MTPSASTSNLTMLNRRARYIVALEQLGSSDPTVRMSGVYALVWLVDEWMNTDDAPAGGAGGHQQPVRVCAVPVFVGVGVCAFFVFRTCPVH